MLNRAQRREASKRGNNDEVVQTMQRAEENILKVAKQALNQLGYGSTRLTRFTQKINDLCIQTDRGVSLIKEGYVFEGYVHKITIPRYVIGKEEVRQLIRGCERRMLAVVKKALYQEFGFGAVRLERYMEVLNTINNDCTSSSVSSN